MDNKERIEKSGENHLKGFNCAQSIACAYSDLVGVDEKTMFQLASGFGAGMGGMKATCGAVSGAIMVAGMMALPDGRIIRSKGTLEGRIGNKITGENGFGYDPIFFIPEKNCYSAELSTEEKNKISHRGKAMAEMREKILEIL